MPARAGRRRERGRQRQSAAHKAVMAGWEEIKEHPLFAPIAGAATVRFGDPESFPPEAWAIVTGGGTVVVHPSRRGDQRDWVWVFAHCLLHLGFGHLTPVRADRAGGPDPPPSGLMNTLDAAYVAACDVAVNRFLATLRLGRPVVPVLPELPAGDERALAAGWRRAGQVPPELVGCGTAGMLHDLAASPGGDPAFGVAPWHGRGPTHWDRLLAAGLADAARAALEVAGGVRATLAGGDGRVREWHAARNWFISAYPLLGALAATMTLVADADLARRWDIPLAAVSAAAGEIYVNPLAQLVEDEWRFVLAHEMLHAGLRHETRAGGRDPYLWNVAADFVINGWLVELGVGKLPAGCLYDPELKGLSAEAVYDRITTDLRRYRKLSTMRGRPLPDVLGQPLPGSCDAVGGVDLDELYRRALLTGLSRHNDMGRGFVPAGLEQAIRALEHPPPSWDVELARWFDEHVRSPEWRRTYARASRRQAATPEIPRPGRFRPLEVDRAHTFGVLLDTSGSMNARLLGKALGAVASFALARDVPAARVVFCDAVAYDAGYLPVEVIASEVRVRGRGGTVLQPGVDLLERAEDFPPDGPILVITDGQCDRLRIRRTHAFLVPAGAMLPFTPRGPVFRMR